MPTKVFTLMGGGCPFGQGCEIDSPSCRKCQWFYRTGTGTFFWCNNPDPKSEESVLKSGESVPKTTKNVPEIRKRVNKTTKSGTEPKKRGRPAGKAEKKPVKTRKKKNG